MMKLAKHHLCFKILNIIFCISFLASCSSQQEQNASVNLLSIPVEGSEIIDHEDFNRLLLQIIHDSDKTDNLFFILSQIWSKPHAKNSVISINKIRADSADFYSAILIFDSIPDDDSVSGYRYDIKLEKNPQQAWQIVEAKESWRCWQNRGHVYFSNEPCS